MADLAEDTWLSISALARSLGRDKAGVSRRVARFEEQCLLATRIGKSGVKLVNRDDFDRVASETVNAIQEANGRAASQINRMAAETNGRRRSASRPAAEADTGDASGPVLSHEQARKTRLAADIAQLQLDELRGMLVRVADISAGAAMQGETLARRIYQMLPEWADDLAAVVVWSDEMSHANEDVELARAWLQGKSALMDDLADLVESMMGKQLDAAARTFISTIGNAAKASAKREARPTPSARRTPAPPPAEPLPAAPVDFSEILRRRREREHARRLDELGRRNQEAFMEQHAFMAGNQMRNGADWREW